MKKILTTLIFVFLLTSCSPTIKTNLVPNNDTILVGNPYTLKGCKVSINKNEYSMKVLENTIDNQEVGEYQITYYYDYNEERILCYRKVFVTDQEAPTVSLNPGIDTITLGAEWIDKGVSYEDNYYETLEVQIYSTVDTSKVGDYVVIYTVIDGSNNQTTIERHVTVIGE